MAATSEQKVKKSSFLKGVRSEFKKIVWPSKADTVKYTALVIGISIVVSLIIWGMDMILRGAVGLLIGS